MATRLDRVEIYNETLLSLKIQGPLVTWSCMDLYYHRPRASKLGRWWLTMRISHLESHTTLWTRGHVRSSDKLKTLYLHYHNAYDHQTARGAYIPWGASFHKVRRSFDQAVFPGDHVTNYRRYISTTARSMTIKFGKVVGYYKGLPRIKSHNPPNKW